MKTLGSNELERPDDGAETPDFQAGFAAEIVRHRIGSATLAVLRCTVVSQLTPSPGLAQQTLQVLLNDLVDFGRKFLSSSYSSIELTA